MNTLVTFGSVKHTGVDRTEQTYELTFSDNVVVEIDMDNIENDYGVQGEIELAINSYEDGISKAELKKAVKALNECIKDNAPTMEEIIEAGKKLAAANMVATYKAGSHSHDADTLFPQTAAQYRWLRKNYGTTANVCINGTIEDVLNVCPELSGYIKPTKSGRFSRIEITL